MIAWQMLKGCTCLVLLLCLPVVLGVTLTWYPMVWLGVMGVAAVCVVRTRWDR